jgi:hypothetical protein
MALIPATSVEGQDIAHQVGRTACQDLHGAVVVPCDHCSPEPFNDFLQLHSPPAYVFFPTFMSQPDEHMKNFTHDTIGDHAQKICIPTPAMEPV